MIHDICLRFSDIILTHHRVVVSNMFYFHPYLGKIPMLTNIFQRGWNHQLVILTHPYCPAIFNHFTSKVRPIPVCQSSLTAKVKLWTRDCCSEIYGCLDRKKGKSQVWRTLKSIKILSKQVGWTWNTLPETNIAPEKWWLEDYVSFKIPYFQGIC